MYVYASWQWIRMQRVNNQSWWGKYKSDVLSLKSATVTPSMGLWFRTEKVVRINQDKMGWTSHPGINQGWDVIRNDNHQTWERDWFVCKYQPVEHWICLWDIQTICPLTMPAQSSELHLGIPPPLSLICLPLTHMLSDMIPHNLRLAPTIPRQHRHSPGIPSHRSLEPMSPLHVRQSSSPPLSLICLPQIPMLSAMIPRNLRLASIIPCRHRHSLEITRLRMLEPMSPLHHRQSSTPTLPLPQSTTSWDLHY